MRTEIIRTKIVQIRESLELIRKNLPEDFEDFASLGLIKDGIYKRIEFCIQNIFDICAILDTDLRLGIPHSDDDILEIMVTNGIINKDLKAKLKLMKGFRNILVHRYGRIDDALSYEFLNVDISDFDEFIETISEYINGI